MIFAVASRVAYPSAKVLPCERLLTLELADELLPVTQKPTHFHTTRSFAAIAPVKVTEGAEVN